MNSNRMSEENIAVTQSILFLSYRQELYGTIRSRLAGQHDILYHRIREKENQDLPLDGNVSLCIVEMLRFTVKSEELIRKIKSRSDAAILFLSGAGTERIRRDEMVRAIKSGADGYLARSQSAEEIAAEIRALLRIQERVRERPEVWECGELQIMPGRRQVFLKGQEICLTHIEFDIVHYLASQNGRTVTYKELYEAVWHSEYLSDDESIMAHIHRIRLKLETDRKHPFYIQNVYGVGYRFGYCCTKKLC